MTERHILSVHPYVGPQGALSWLFTRIEQQPKKWLYEIDRIECTCDYCTSKPVAWGSGFDSPSAAFEAGGEVLARYEPKAPSRDDEALLLQMQANRRDVHCTGAY